MPQKNRAALYLRVSTADQKPDLQFDGLRAYAERAELDIVRDYLGVAVSGRRQGRPQLDALMRDARHRAFDCVLVWKFDRFARSTKHLLTALEEFNHLGIRFVSVQDQIDTTSPMGKAMFTLVGAMAELESSLISEIEFQAVAHDGVLDIPPEHRRVLDGKKVRVVLVDAEPQNSDANETIFSRLRKVKTQGPADLSTNHDAYVVGERDA